MTDPPYELGFMGKVWDGSGIVYDVAGGVANMTERTSRWSAENLQRIYSDRYGGDDQSVARLARSYIILLDENERLRATQVTTLVACSRCGHGQRARHMVAVGDGGRDGVSRWYYLRLALNDRLSRLIARWAR